MVSAASRRVSPGPPLRAGDKDAARWRKRHVFELSGGGGGPQALTEAEEERVDTHVVHAEESVGDEVAAEHNRLQMGRQAG